ncbi:MAG: hypothetical protein INH37_14830 [Myxococcaceae bacterium]|nr:hypothetical protein [Myxococcaceae bacterium]
MNHDVKCRLAITRSVNLVVPWWLMASYLYYCKDTSILSDAQFDELGVILAERWDAIEHPHKHLIKPDLTKSGFYLKEADYPLICRSAAERLAAELETK